jgi:hypothetical protein
VTFPHTGRARRPAADYRFVSIPTASRATVRSPRRRSLPAAHATSGFWVAAPDGVMPPERLRVHQRARHPRLVGRESEHLERCVRDSQRRLPESMGCAWLEPKARVIPRCPFQEDERDIAFAQQFDAADQRRSDPPGSDAPARPRSGSAPAPGASASARRAGSGRTSRARQSGLVPSRRAKSPSPRLTASRSSSTRFATTGT